MPAILKSRRRIAALLILLLALAGGLVAIQTQQVDIGLGGGYDGTVYITRDTSGRMVFRDNQVTTPTTLFNLWSPGAFHVEDLGTSGSAGAAPVGDGAGHLHMTDIATQTELDTDATSLSTALAALVGGSGTPNFIPKFTASRTLANSQIGDDGVNVVVGSGTYASGDGRLIVSDASNPGIALRGAGGNAPGVVALNAGGSFASPTALTAGTAMFTFGAGGYNGSAWVYNKAVMQLLGAENWSSTANGTYMIFSTTPIGSTSRQIRLLIGNDGSIGIGTTTPRRRADVLDSANPQLRLSQADNSKYADFQADASGYLTISPSGSRLGINGAPGEALDLAAGNARVKSGTLQVGNAAAAAYNRLGTATTNHSLSGASDLVVGGKLESQGDLYVDGAIWRNGQRVASSENLLDNPDFNIWQRNISMGAAAGGDSGGTMTYPVPGTLSLGADRWQASRSTSGTSATISRATPPGSLATAEYAMKIQAAVGSPCRFYIHQTLPRSRTRALRGKSVTFAVSSYMTGTDGGNIALYKTVGGAVTQLANYNYASSANAWDRLAITAQIPSDADCLVVSVQPEISASGTTTAYFANATLVEGKYVATSERVTDPAASSLPPIPRDPAADLASCQRFYEKGSLMFTVYSPNTSTNAYQDYVHYQTAKNSSPTVAIGNYSVPALGSPAPSIIEQPAYAAGQTFPSGFIFYVSGATTSAATVSIGADWTATCAEPI